MIDEEKQKKLIDKAKEIFGTTESCKRAGYILPDGDMLDFGNPDEKKIENRLLAHSSILQVYNSLPEIKLIKENGACFKYSNIDQFLLETGAIRLTAEAHYQISNEMHQPNIPTKKQIETLEYCSCILQPTEKIIMEFAKCDNKGQYVPKNFSQRINKNDCVEPINDLNKAIKKWQTEKIRS